MLTDAVVYEGGRLRQSGLTIAEALRLHRGDGSGFLWLAFVDPTEAELAQLREGFDLHELVAEDILSAHERPKFEEFDGDDHLMILRSAHHNGDGVHFGELAVYLGDGFVLSARKGGAHAQGSARARLESRPDLLEKGEGSVLWAILDKAVTDIRPVVDTLDEELIELEADIFTDAEDPAPRIYRLRRQLSDLYRAVHPMLGPLEAVTRGGSPRLEPMRRYLRDEGDAVRLLDEDIAAQRERLTSALETSLALIARRQNDSVRKVSGWAAIVAVPTLIAGIYGMNFQHMPTLDWRIGFPLCIITMVLVASLVYWGLRRAQWM